MDSYAGLNTTRRKHILLPISVVNELHCSDCLNYLSVGPINIYQNEKMDPKNSTPSSCVLCGRCVNKKEYMNAKATPSLYTKIAEACIFKCVNYYNGCNKYLFFNQAKEHEPICNLKKEFNCHFCPFIGNSCQFTQHMKQYHYNNTADNGKILIHLNKKYLEDYIFYTKCSVFLIKVCIDTRLMKIAVIPLSNSFFWKEYKLNFNQPKSNNLQYLSSIIQLRPAGEIPEKIDVDVMYLGEIFRNSVIHCKIIFGERNIDEKKILRITEKYSLWEKDLEDLEGQLNTIAQHPFNMLKKIIDLFFNRALECSNCNTEIVKDRFSLHLCPQRHISCSSCLASFCRKCQDYVDWMNLKTTFNDVELPCDWQQCTEKAKFWNFLLHKQACKYREYKCPVDSCDFSGIKSHLVDHWGKFHTDTARLHNGGHIDICVETPCDVVWIIDEVNELVIINAMILQDVLVVAVYEDSTIFPLSYTLSAKFYSDTRIYVPLNNLRQLSDRKEIREIFHNYHNIRLVVNYIFHSS